MTLGLATGEYVLGAFGYTGTPGNFESGCGDKSTDTSPRMFVSCIEKVTYSTVNYLRRLTISIPSAVFKFSDAFNRPLIYLPGSQRTAPIGYESGDRL
jgi:hypothetical protein